MASRENVVNAIRAVEAIIQGIMVSDLTYEYGYKPYAALKQYKADMASDILRELGAAFDITDLQEAAELLELNNECFALTERRPVEPLCLDHELYAVDPGTEEVLRCTKCTYVTLRKQP